MPLLRVQDLDVRYSVRGIGRFGFGSGEVHAVTAASFTLAPGETLGVVGETGCGKSSLGRAILRLVEPARGSVSWKDRDLADLSGTELLGLRREMQIIFQDPLSSLDPRMTVGEIIEEPLLIHESEMDTQARKAAVADIMEKVGLHPSMSGRYPGEFSGGQCQRVSIARAMILKPGLVVCDEPVSALDVSIQAQICNLLKELQRETGVSLLFISHDLSVVRYMADRTLVMYLGRIMECADTETLFDSPLHPYTKALIDAVPVPDPDTSFDGDMQLLEGDIPSPLAPPTGCVFRTRCPKAVPVCISKVPPTDDAGMEHEVACHRWRESTQTSSSDG